MASANTQQMSAQQINQLARQAIRQRSVRMCQQIYSQSVNTVNSKVDGQVVTVNPRNVGLILGFWVKVSTTFTNTSAQSTSVFTISDFGGANLLSQIQFNDLSNNTRIQTPGWHVNLINSWKGRRPFASASVGVNSEIASGAVAAATPFSSFAGIDAPTNYGSSWAPNSAKPTIAYNSATGTVTQWYYVPLAYNPDHPQTPDLRGAVYANVVNATMQLLLTLNTAPVSAYQADSTSAVYLNLVNEPVVYTNTSTVTVYQDYYDQLPTGPQGVLLPILDLATIYELKFTNATAITQAQDYPYQYANFRDFLSTIAIYNNNGSYNSSTGGRQAGSDINYWALQSANFTNIWKEEPNLVAIRTRQHLGTDLPPGSYMFDSRTRPISTTQYGNMQLVLNTSLTSAGAYMLVAVEDFALVQSLSMAGSLAAS